MAAITYNGLRLQATQLANGQHEIEVELGQMRTRADHLVDSGCVTDQSSENFDFPRAKPSIVEPNVMAVTERGSDKVGLVGQTGDDSLTGGACIDMAANGLISDYTAMPVNFDFVDDVEPFHAGAATVV